MNLKLERYTEVRRDLAGAVVVFLLGLILVSPTAHAQWRTQELDLKPGWNSVYLHVDASHTNIDQFLEELSGAVTDEIDADEIEQVWCWAASYTDQQFITSPDQPSQTSTNWLVWEAGDQEGESLKSFIGNSAFLIKVSDSGSGGILPVVGKPVPPVYRWNTNGINFIGFSTIRGADDQFPPFNTFFEQGPPALETASIYYYDGGADSSDLESTNGGSSVTVNRGSAYWVDAGSGFYNRYFGTFKLTLQDLSGMEFGTTLSQYRVKIENLTGSDLTVSWDWFSDNTPSEGGTEESLEQDAGQPEILLRRDGFNTDSLTFDVAESMVGAASLAPAETSGDSVELIFGVDRSLMSGSNPYTGILAFKDETSGFFQVEVPVSAEVNSTGGLWVGEVAINSVSQGADYYLTETVNGEEKILYDENNDAILDPNHYEFVVIGGAAEILYRDGLPIRAFYATDPIVDGVIDETPSYDLDFYETDESGTNPVFETVTPDLLSDDTQPEVQVPVLSSTATSVAKAYPMRLIVHVNDSGEASLLQRVYYGFETVVVEGQEVDVPILATTESSLESDRLADSRRISSVHFPYSEANTPWALSDTFGTGTISTEGDGISVSYDDFQSNPFLHAYHPDHNNLDGDFDVEKQEAIGEESYGIQRAVSISFESPDDDFESLTASSRSVTGTYLETMTIAGKDFGLGSHEVSFTFSGPFVLNQISDIKELVLASE